jgi:hypothetical protein
MKSKSGGFLLLELAVAIVILATLLITVKGYRGMRIAADINLIGAEWQKYRTAVKDFRTIYQNWPGDLLSTQIVGKLGASSDYGTLPTANWASPMTDDRIVSAFKQLSRAFPEIGITINSTGTLPGTIPAFPNVDGTTVHTVTSAMLNVLTPKLNVNVYPDAFFALQIHDNATAKTSLRFGSLANTFTPTSGANLFMYFGTVSKKTFYVLAPALASAIDTKLDDGEPFGGQIAVAYQDASNGCVVNSAGAAISTLDGATVLSTANYSGTVKTQVCYLAFLLDTRY